MSIFKTFLLVFSLILNSGTLSFAKNKVSSLVIDRYEKGATISLYRSLISGENEKKGAIELYNLGIMNLSRDTGKAIAYFKKSAKKGVVKAKFNIGSHYLSLVKNKHNRDKAKIWFQKAAKQKFPPAQYNLAIILGEYSETDENKARAIELYTSAAKSGHAPAQTNLGVIFAKGEGVEKNLEKAIEYFSLGAEQNYTLAFYNLGVAYEEKNRILSSPIYNIYAVRWYKRAALRGNLKSMINLGTMLSREIGSVKDLKEAHKWVNISIAIKCRHDRLACKWSEELFEGPATPIINFLWDLRIEIERQMLPAQIKEAHTVAKRLILKNKFIREQIK